MDIRFAKTDEKRDITEIWRKNFNEDDIYLDFWFGNYYNPQKTVVCANSNKICGAVHFINCYLSKEKSAYICGLSVNEEHRGKNIASKMLGFLHSYLKEQKYSYCFLMPSISKSFYEKFGYTEVIKGKDKILTKNACVPFSVCHGDEISVYDEYCRNFDLSLERSREYYGKIRTLYKKYGGDILTVTRNGKAIGYFIYGNENGVPVIYESVFLTDDGESVISNYFKTNVKEKHLPVMIKSLCKNYNKEKCIVFMH